MTLLPEDILQRIAAHFELEYAGVNLMPVRRAAEEIGSEKRVRDPRSVLSEAARVLKPGGYLHFVAPNYGSIWEDHYNFVWIPNCPRGLAKVYVRLLGRRADFIDTLQLLTPGLIRSIVRDLPLDVRSLGVEVWEHRLDASGGLRVGSGSRGGLA